MQRFELFPGHPFRTFLHRKRPKSSTSSILRLQKLRILAFCRRTFSRSSIYLTKMPPKQKYTDPKLRDQVKEEIQGSDKGGAPGQWSARKVSSRSSTHVTANLYPEF